MEKFRQALLKFFFFPLSPKKKVGVVEKSSYIYDIPLLESNQEAYARGDISHVHREWTSENYTRVKHTHCILEATLTEG